MYLPQEIYKNVTNYVPSLWHITNLDTDFDEDQIPTGSYVSFYNEDLGDYAFGIYINLWEHKHAGDTSPYVCDFRTMAYIQTLEGTTYADIEHIALIDDFDDIDWLRYEMVND